MEVTFDLPEELATRLRPHQAQLPFILELGLRAVEPVSANGFDEVDDVLKRLKGSLSPEEVLTLRPSPALQSRISYLLEKNRNEGLSSEEEVEWERYDKLEHQVRLAKINALAHLKVA